jgi:bifunctional N-acetylglucosamine-1-phosphate-uridyltransferase/glucosamine-1-phosphate-acetyltransferase GlmU-like protein
MLTAQSFFDLADYDHPQLIKADAVAWNGLKNLKAYMDGQSYPVFSPDLIQDGVPLKRTFVYYNGTLLESREFDIEYGDATKGGLKVFHDGQPLIGASVIMAGAVLCGRQIHLGKGVLVESGALIKGPTIIGDQTEVRQGAYMRGYCLIGRNCVIGHVTEVKHSIFLDGAKAGHFAYLGDSILGNQVNLGAGTKLANLRFIKGDIPIKTPGSVVNSNLRKMGAILGDHVQTGCNSVTNPGTLLGKRSIVMANCNVPSGYHEDNSLIKR